MKKSKGVDKRVFKQIFEDHWEEFKKHHPMYNNPDIEKEVKKMLGCGDPENGYAKYICPKCLETKVVPFSCKSSFCLTCGRKNLDKWVRNIMSRLFKGVRYKHIVLTLPQVLWIYFYRNIGLLEKLMECGISFMREWVVELKGGDIECGIMQVIQTNGRSASYNPHLHHIMTWGGLRGNEGCNKEWERFDFVPFKLLHKKWKYHVLKMMEENISQKDREGRDLIKELWEKYPEGFVVDVSTEDVPNSKGLAAYLVKYVISPPIALSRIIKYNGKKVRYWYKDHRTKKAEEVEIPALEFIGRMVQHIRGKNFQRIRYYGLHATCMEDKIRIILKELLRESKEGYKDLIEHNEKKGYRQSIKESFGIDPLECKRCKEEMWLLEIWHPKYGVMHDEIERIREGRSRYTNDDYEKEEERKRHVWSDNGRRSGDNGQCNLLQVSLY